MLKITKHTAAKTAKREPLSEINNPQSEVPSVIPIFAALIKSPFASSFASGIGEVTTNCAILLPTPAKIPRMMRITLALQASYLQKQR